MEAAEREDWDDVVWIDDELGPDVLELMARVTEIAAGGEACWATDLNAGGAALLIELLAAQGAAAALYPRTDRASRPATYRGDGKTEAKDARIIADKARMRTDLQPVLVRIRSAWICGS
jgi:hypothetical protein